MTSIFQSFNVLPAMDDTTRRSRERELLAGAVCMELFEPDTFEFEIACYMWEQALVALYESGMTMMQIKRITNPDRIAVLVSELRQGKAVAS